MPPPCVPSLPLLSPEEAVQSPTLFLGWLGTDAPGYFACPTEGTTCPLAQFLVAACHISDASVGSLAVLYYTPEGDAQPVRTVVLPAWTRTFIRLWDVYAQAWPKRTTARAAGRIARLAGWLRCS